MPRPEIIQALKDNKVPFGLMSKEMQDKAKLLGRSLFKKVNNLGHWDYSRSAYEPFALSGTYRLRPDYTDEPEVVECEVFNDAGILHCKCGKDGDRTLEKVALYADFIGFKYENDQDYIRPFIRMYRLKNSLGSDAVVRMYKRNIDKYEVLTPTHVLFRKTK